MYYLRARHYKQQVGRFLTADTTETSFTRDQWIEIPLHPFTYGSADPVGKVDPSGHVEVAIAWKNSQVLVDAFIKTIAVGVLGYCVATEFQNDPRCRNLNSGKIQAQGDVFGRNSGVGYTSSWSQQIPPTVSQGITGLAAIWAQLTPPEEGALGTAFKDAAKWIANRPPTGITSGRSFFQ